MKKARLHHGRSHHWIRFGWSKLKYLVRTLFVAKNPIYRFYFSFYIELRQQSFKWCLIDPTFVQFLKTLSESFSVTAHEPWLICPILSHSKPFLFQLIEQSGWLHKLQNEARSEGQNFTVINQSDYRGANIVFLPILEFRSFIIRVLIIDPLYILSSWACTHANYQKQQPSNWKLRIIYISFFSLYFSGEAEFGVF